MEMPSDAHCSLLRMIHDLLFSPRISIASSSRDILFSAFNYACLLGCTLESCSGGVTSLNEQMIMEVVRQLEDAIEFSVSTQFLSQSDEGSLIFSLDLHHLRRDVHAFSVVATVWEQYVQRLWNENASKMIEDDVMELCMPHPSQYDDKEEEEEEDCDDMVGLSDQFCMIRGKLAPMEGTEAEWEGMSLWISGMAGIGKTAAGYEAFPRSSGKGEFRVSGLCQGRPQVQASTTSPSYHRST